MTFTGRCMSFIATTTSTPATSSRTGKIPANPSVCATILERLRAASNAKGVAALEGIGGDPTRWDLRAWNSNMAWAFKTNVPTPNLDRRLLFP